MRRLHHLLAMKDKVIKNSDDNRERFEYYKAIIEAHTAMYAPAEGLRVQTEEGGTEGSPTDEAK